VLEVELEDPELMRRPPRDPKARLFGKRLVGLSLLQGASVLTILLAVFLLTLQRGKGELEARSVAFATLMIANLALIFVNRSWHRSLFETLRAPNQALWWVTGAGGAFLALTLYVPLLRELFRFTALQCQRCRLVHRGRDPEYRLVRSPQGVRTPPFGRAFCELS
jgi:Ca2+-transporting ATPase